MYTRTEYKDNTISVIDERTFAYSDTAINNFNVIIKKNFRKTTVSDQYLESIDFAYYNSKKQKFKDIRVDPGGDTISVLLFNTDSSKGEIGEPYFPGTCVTKSVLDTNCYKIIRKDFTEKNKRNQELTIKELLSSNRNIIYSKECKNLLYTYISNDSLYSINISHLDNMHERKVTISSIIQMAAANSR